MWLTETRQVGTIANDDLRDMGALRVTRELLQLVLISMCGLSLRLEIETSANDSTRSTGDLLHTAFCVTLGAVPEFDETCLLD